MTCSSAIGSSTRSRPLLFASASAFRDRTGRRQTAAALCIGAFFAGRIFFTGDTLRITWSKRAGVALGIGLLAYLLPVPSRRSSRKTVAARPEVNGSGKRPSAQDRVVEMTRWRWHQEQAFIDIVTRLEFEAAQDRPRPTLCAHTGMP
jgi:hypothetical protein